MSLHPALVHLQQADPVLAALIPLCPAYNPTPAPDLFAALSQSIVSQQLSTRAAETLWTRAKGQAGGDLTPASAVALGIQGLMQAGLSRAKASAIWSIAALCQSGGLDLTRLPDLSDAEVIRTLTTTKGVGPWTAHMFLIFALCRPDVLPVGDMGVRKAAQRRYALADLPDAIALTALAEARGWRPFRSAASWVLWRSLDMP